MALRFRRTASLAPGVRVNLNTRGVSVRVGPKGAGVTVGNSGARVSAGLPGTGLYVYQQVKRPQVPGQPSATNRQAQLPPLELSQTGVGQPFPERLEKGMQAPKGRTAGLVLGLLFLVGALAASPIAGLIVLVGLVLPSALMVRRRLRSARYQAGKLIKRSRAARD